MERLSDLLKWTYFLCLSHWFAGEIIHSLLYKGKCCLCSLEDLPKDTLILRQLNQCLSLSLSDSKSPQVSSTSVCGFVSVPWVCKHKRTAPLVHHAIVGGLLFVISQESRIMEASVTSVGS